MCFSVFVVSLEVVESVFVFGVFMFACNPYTWSVIICCLLFMMFCLFVCMYDVSYGFYVFVYLFASLFGPYQTPFEP